MPVNGFSRETHFLSGRNSLAFFGSKENVSFLKKLYGWILLTVYQAGSGKTILRFKISKFL
jgi:hypothetical protein